MFTKAPKLGAFTLFDTVFFSDKVGEELKGDRQMQIQSVAEVPDFIHAIKSAKITKIKFESCYCNERQHLQEVILKTKEGKRLVISASRPHGNLPCAPIALDVEQG